MAEAYATFAARGIHCDPMILEKVTDRNGKELDIAKGNCQRVMSEDVADGMNKLLASVVTKGTGARARTADGRPQAGKTGTINSNEAVWYVGYTPEIAGAAMISIDNTKKPFIKSKKAGFRRSGVKGYTVPSTDFNLEGSGSGDAGQDIWKPAMQRYLDGIPRTGFKNPPAKIERGKIIDVPRVFGLGMRAATKKFEKEGFNVVPSYIYSRAAGGHLPRVLAESRLAGAAVQHDLRPVLEGPRPRRGRRRRARPRRRPRSGPRREREPSREGREPKTKAAAKKKAADAEKKAAAEAGGELRPQRRRAEPVGYARPEPVEGALSPTAAAPRQPPHRRRLCPWSAGSPPPSPCRCPWDPARRRRSGRSRPRRSG